MWDNKYIKFKIIVPDTLEIQCNTSLDNYFATSEQSSRGKREENWFFNGRDEYIKNHLPFT